MKKNKSPFGRFYNVALYPQNPLSPVIDNNQAINLDRFKAMYARAPVFPHGINWAAISFVMTAPPGQAGLALNGIPGQYAPIIGRQPNIAALNFLYNIYDGDTSTRWIDHLPGRTSTNQMVGMNGEDAQKADQALTHHPLVRDSVVLSFLGHRQTPFGTLWTGIGGFIESRFGEPLLVLLNDEEKKEEKRQYAIVVQGINGGAPVYKPMMEEYNMTLLLIFQGLFFYFSFKRIGLTLPHGLWENISKTRQSA
jgi:hypothetical protein